MNKTLVILALLCGTATAGELTKAQKAEVAKKIKLLEEEIEKTTKQIEQTPPDRKGEIRLLNAHIKSYNEMKQKMIDEESVYWEKLKTRQKYKRLYWKEPAKGEKEGKWVPWKEVAG